MSKASSFVWTPDELRPLLGDDADLVMGYYGVTERGNFEGANILNVPLPPERYASQRGVSEDDLSAAVQRARAVLLDVRERRIHPLLDDKVLTSWNGLMLRSFAEAGAALGRPDYLDAAGRNADFLLATMRDENGRLLRTWRNGEAKLNGYLEDYACLADGLISLHEATLEPRWLQDAVGLANGMVDLFWDDAVGGFYDTGKDHEELVVRPRDVFDNAQPCGGSVATDVLLRLGVITGNDDFAAKGATPLRAMQQMLGRAPSATGHWLGALDFYVSLPREIVIVGPGERSGHRRNAGRGEQTVYAQPCPGGRSGFRQPAPEGLPAPGAADHAGRYAHCLRVRELRLPVACNGPGSAVRPVGQVTARAITRAGATGPPAIPFRGLRCREAGSAATGRTRRGPARQP